MLHAWPAPLSTTSTHECSRSSRRTHPAPCSTSAGSCGSRPAQSSERIRRYLSSGLIARRAAVLDPRALDEVLLALVLVELKSGAAEVQAALRRRLLDAPEVQQCYDVAGRWDYVVVLTARDMPHCRELVAHLFDDDPDIERCETLPVFDAVKLGLAVPTRPPGR